MSIDLHTHSTASDGTDAPAALLAAAVGAGLTTVAITDHDTTGGWAPAARALPPGLTLVRGAEFSTSLPWAGRTMSVHLLGYLFDPADPDVRAEHDRLREERRSRGTAIVDRLVAAGVPISRQQVIDIAAGAPIGRPHIGRALVQSGVVRTVSEAFASLLSSAGPYYVPKRDTDLPVAVELIRRAGGVSVLAHPRGRGAERVLTDAVIAELTEAGLDGVEVDHPDHDPAARAGLRALAGRLGLLTTGSSDYHGSNKEIRLGAETTAADVLAEIERRGRIPVLRGGTAPGPDAPVARPGTGAPAPQAPGPAAARAPVAR